MRRDPVSIVWIIGAVVTVLVYLAGPEHFFYWLFYELDQGWTQIAIAIDHLSIASFNLLRAAAVGLFVVFMTLTLLVIRAGGRGRAAFLFGGGTFLLLVAQSRWYDVGNARWFAALVLAAVGAAVMSRRLRGGLH